jgi:hypothetical protein
MTTGCPSRTPSTKRLGVPEGSAQYATEISGIPTKYVELYRLNTQPNGLKTPAPLNVDEGFYFANEHYRFCIGVCVERPESPSDGAVFVEFRVEECGELWATLVVENIQGSIHVADIRDTKSFDEAAAVALNLVMTAMKDRREKSKKPVQIGFHTRLAP